MNGSVIRRVKEQGRAIALLILVTVTGLVVAGYILSNQRFYLPGWVPVLGQDWFELRGEFTAAPGVMPGQGQAVTVAGVRVGEVTRVALRDGRAVVSMNLRPQYARVRPDATMLLRPKTGLKDMVVELDPGTAAAGPLVPEGTTLGIAATDPDVNIDEILAMLDADTRASLVALVTDGGTALGDAGGRRLAQVLRRFEPLSRHTAEATRLVARRRVQLARLMGNLSKIAVALGDNDRQLSRFVAANSGAFRRFAAQRDALSQTLARVPDTLAQAEPALRSVARLGRRLETSTAALHPAARDLAGAFAGVRPFLRETEPVLRTQLRPFARAAQPALAQLAPATRDIAAATPGLTQLATVLNELFDALAYDPPGDEEPYLFYVPWANHNTNSVLSSQDGVGATRRSLVMVSCGSAQLLEILPRNNPTLDTLTQLINVPKFDALVAAGKCQAPPAGSTPDPAAEPAPAAAAIASTPPVTETLP